ncbi:MAG: terminase [Oscillospiraceae bacterium]|nr:terminase [Oscillospiraceae bacterium]
MTLAESPAVKYAEWCVIEDNRYVPIYVKKQCAVWLDIVKGLDSEAYVCEKTFRKIRKILRLMIHPDLQKPLSVCMEDYAWLLIVAVFCTKTREGNYRLYQTALLEICRKNFKTFYSGVIFIIGMIIKPKFSRFFSVAPDLKLSKELQTAIKKIIKSSPALIDNFKTLRSEIRCLLNENEYMPLAYSEDKMDGKLAHMFLADEAGAMDDYPVEAMRSSQITLREKLGIIISTQYPNDNNVMLTEIDYAKQVLDGLIQDKTYFALLYEPDDDVKAGDKWQTEDLVLYQSNPVAYAHPYIMEDLKKKRAKAVLYENKRENFLCKHCNIQYKSLGVEGFIEITKLRECKIEENIEFWRGRRVWLGLDLSMTEDNTSVAMVTEADGMLYAKVWGFVPQDRIEAKIEKEKLDYKALIRAGVCFGVGDDVIDYGEIERFILSVAEKYGVEIVQVGYDRYNALSTVQKLEENYLECVEIKQHSSVLHPPTKLLKEYILHKTFRYEENLLLEVNFQNAKCTYDTNMNRYINKKKSAKKVDCVVAIINALYLLQQDMLNPSNFGGQYA